MRVRVLITGLLVGLATSAVPVGASGSAGAQRAASIPVCAGVARCQVVSRVDVNGDGKPDAVALARRGKVGTQSSFVLVRVKVSPTRIVTARRGTPFWPAIRLWHGAAHLDGLPGRELVVARTSGAHAVFQWVLTWRGGRLLTLRSPGGAIDWLIDGAANVDFGWQRTNSDPPGLIRSRSAERQPDGRMKGTIRTYQWTPGRWSQTDAATIDPMTQSQANSWAGWQVPGLARYL